MRNPKWSDFYLLQFEFQFYLESFGLVLGSSIKFVFWDTESKSEGFANKIVWCIEKKGIKHIFVFAYKFEHIVLFTTFLFKVKSIVFMAQALVEILWKR